MASTLTIGTRGSQLALAQTHLVRRLLLDLHPGLEVRVEVLQTKGDVTRGPLRAVGGEGVFTRELEHALLNSRIDLAVHSLKDLPTATHPDLALAATPQREDVRDVLVSRNDAGLWELPPAALVGTGSLRRQAQLKSLRPDLRFVEIRGNLDTRIRKVEAGDCDAVVLAAAGLHRLGWRDRISAYLDRGQVLPAVGQAALGLQMRAGDPLVPLVRSLDHAPTSAAVTAERSFLAHLGGGCQAPIAAWGRQEEGVLRLDGVVGRPDGSRLLRAAAEGSSADPGGLGARLAAEMIQLGAEALLAE